MAHEELGKRSEFYKLRRRAPAVHKVPCVCPMLPSPGPYPDYATCPSPAAPAGPLVATKPVPIHANQVLELLNNKTLSSATCADDRGPPYLQSAVQQNLAPVPLQPKPPGVPAVFIHTFYNGTTRGPTITLLLTRAGRPLERATPTSLREKAKQNPLPQTHRHWYRRPYTKPTRAVGYNNIIQACPPLLARRVLQRQLHNMTLQSWSCGARRRWHPLWLATSPCSSHHVLLRPGATCSTPSWTSRQGSPG